MLTVSNDSELSERNLAVSVVIPVHNEQDSINTTIEAIDLILAKNNINYEIITVDDGSTDKTPQRLRELQLRHPHLLILEQETNLGYGAALKTGITRSSYDKVLIIDADQTYPVHDIPDLLRLSLEFDMVVGSRVGPDAQIPLVRRSAKTVLKFLAEFLSNRDIPDLNSGFRVFKKEIALNSFHMLPDGFSFTSTLTLIAIHKGFTIHYIPTSYFKREGKSKIKPIRDTLNFFQLILRTILYVNPLRIFMPASLFFFVVSSVLFIIRVALGGGFLVTIILTFICGFELLVVGMLADLIDKRIR